MSSQVNKQLVWWLRRKPLPDAIRCTTPEGPKVVSIDHSAAQKWAETVRSVTSLHSTRLEALDSEGNVIRVRSLDEDDPDPELDEDDLEDRRQLADPNSPAELMKLNAKLVADAYKHSTEVAFSRMVDLFNTVSGHMATMAKSVQSFERLQNKSNATIERLAVRRAGKADEKEADDGDSLSTLFKTFLEGQEQARANGAADVEPEPEPEAPEDT